MIALSFTWLYYHQGMKKIRKDNSEKYDDDIQEIINITNAPDEIFNKSNLYEERSIKHDADDESLPASIKPMNKVD